MVLIIPKAFGYSGLGDTFYCEPSHEYTQQYKSQQNGGSYAAGYPDRKDTIVSYYSPASYRQNQNNSNHTNVFFHVLPPFCCSNLAYCFYYLTKFSASQVIGCYLQQAPLCGISMVKLIHAYCRFY